MRLLCCLPWTVAVALQSSSWEESWEESREDGPRRRVFGPEHRNCKAGSKERIVGGRIVDDPDRYPFLAWIGDKDGTGMAQFCGGSLIHPRVVMTAGHCVYGDNARNAGIYVRLRLANFARTKGVERDVVNWKVHESFNKNTLDHDIALFLLDQEVSAEEVVPVALSNDTAEGALAGEPNATITGWGSTDEECYMYDTYLRDSHVPIGQGSGGTCGTQGSRMLRKKDIDMKRQICAGYYKRNSMEYPGCGDSGGPLLTFDADSGNFTQVGFVSWSYGVPYPDVFTRVSAYRDWIDESISALLEAGHHRVVRAIRGEAQEEVPPPPKETPSHSPFSIIR